MMFKVSCQNCATRPKNLDAINARLLVLFVWLLFSVHSRFRGDRHLQIYDDYSFDKQNSLKSSDLTAKQLSSAEKSLLLISFTRQSLNQHTDILTV